MKLVIDISEKIYDTIMADEMPTREQMSVIATRIYQGKLYEERPHGKWVPGREISQMWTGNNLVGIDYEDFSCSCCGVVVEESTEPEWNFCPNCGASMRKEGEAEVRTTLGCLKSGETFKYEGRTYKAGHIISGTNGYVACVNVETHKVTRLYIDTTVEKEGDEE